MKTIMFSRTFPATHTRAGEPTFFVEKIWKCLVDESQSSHFSFDWTEYDSAFPVTFDERENIHAHKPKLHTIRAGNRWKVGDMASLRVWTDKPYRSKQIEFAKVEIKQVWDFEIYYIAKDNDLFLFIDNKDFFSFIDYDINAIDFTKDLEHTTLKKLAQNDGLEISDFVSWLGLDKDNPKNFNGQIIAWSDEVNY
jgi:hypothetical protein